MTSFFDTTYADLRQQLIHGGQAGFRADQLCDWVYRKSVTDPARMTNLPAEFTGGFAFFDSRVARQQLSSDGTIKLLLELHDGEHVECVMIPADKRATACVSTQAGCAMGCSFCASGIGGLRRNLTGGEIIQQIMHLQQAAGRRITHVVFMGMGEPLANYEATVWAVRAITDLKRLAISARHVTVSTVGLPKMIRRLADEDIPLTLAISLHAPIDALRRELMPAAAKATIEEIMAAADYFFNARKREVTLEYILMAGVNDTNVCAEALANIAHSLRCSVNLICYNPVEGLPFEAPSPAAVEQFQQRLARRGVNVQIRESRGADITAACGQLRREVR